jgi:hypothetical protein
MQDSHCIISLVLYGIKLWKKKLQSYEWTSFLGDKLKSWAYDDDDESKFDDEDKNMVQMLQCQLKNHRFDYMLS